MDDYFIEMEIYPMNIKRWLLGLAFTVSSILTLPAYAWPEVDHMNMCGAPTKVVHAGWQGWVQHDRYIAKRGNAYYLRTNCPTTVAPVKKAAKKKAVKKSYRKVTKSRRIAKSSKAKSFKRRVKYDEHADCVRVDRMNGVGSAVQAKAYRPVANIAYTARPAVKIAYRAKRPAKRRYNYFKKR